MEIPNSISEDEYSVYSAWIKHHFKEQPPKLLLSSRTFIFDPLGSNGCDGKLLQSQGHVSISLLESLHNLGEAEFPVMTSKFQSAKFKISWNYEESEGLAAAPARPFSRISFSRIAFNRDKTEGLFAVSNSCGGLCGGGGALLATRKNGQWTFKGELGCYWVY